MAYTVFDYETIEIHLGDLLRRSDNLDVHSDAFFPVTLLDRIFHYSERINGLEHDDSNHALHRNFHGHDFDRWVDNCVARIRLNLADSSGRITAVPLVEIDAMTVNSDTAEVQVTLPGSESYTPVDSAGRPVSVTSIDQLGLKIDVSGLFAKPPVDADSEPYSGFGLLARIVRIVCEKSGIEPAEVDPKALSDKIFEYFKMEMLPLIPVLWNDMEHVCHYAPIEILTPGR